MVADFDGEGSAVGGGDVGRIGDDDVELLAGDGREEIALEKADSSSCLDLRFLRRERERDLKMSMAVISASRQFVRES